MPMHRRMVREGRVERPRLPGVRPHRLDSHPRDIAILRQQLRRALVKSRTVRPVGLHVQERRSISTLAPPCAQQQPRPARNAPMLRLPGRHMLRHQQEVLVLRHLRRHVNHARRSHEPAHWDRVAPVVGQVLAANPVHRRVEVRAGVLAHPDRVPIPSRPGAVVARDGLDRDARRRREHRRQPNHRSVRAERLREVHHLE